jgi:uncharacterized membrane protein YgaE (UPF0421/DUF939 family)
MNRLVLRLESLRRLPVGLRMLFAVAVGMCIAHMLSHYLPGVLRYAMWPLMFLVVAIAWFLNRKPCAGNQQQRDGKAL